MFFDRIYFGKYLYIYLLTTEVVVMKIGFSCSMTKSLLIMKNICGKLPNEIPCRNFLLNLIQWQYNSKQHKMKHIERMKRTKLFCVTLLSTIAKSCCFITSFISLRFVYKLPNKWVDTKGDRICIIYTLFILQIYIYFFYLK